MKKIIRLTFYLTLSFLLFSCHQGRVKNYSQELGVITNPRMYHEMIKDDPDKQLVDLENFIPGIKLDIRYATKSNFTKTRIYDEAKAYLRLPVATALKQVQQELNQKGLALKIFDAYRPYSATVALYKAYPDTNFAAAPWNGSRHNRGCAVDVTLISSKTGKELEMPTAFDDFTEKANHNFTDLPSGVIKNRQLLRDVMTRHGFQIYDYEWWHYDFEGWEKYELLDIPFKLLGSKAE